MKKSLGTGLLLLACTTAFAQEALKSTEEEYYDFLSLTGATTRPTLGYRTLSDSVWQFAESEDGETLEESDANIWRKNKLGTRRTIYEADTEAANWFTRGLNRSIVFKAYGPEWYNSYNTDAPHGQNDGALWQGKGYNTSLTGGARLEAFGFDLTVKPQVSFSQNREFEYVTPNYSGNNYTGKADIYGYYGVASIDAPQRFGDSSFWNFDWGDTEVRWIWHSLTFGLGTQSIWLGPARLNPIMHSNNATPYPKFDVGLRKTKITMPHFGWNLGYIEARGWWGKLSESDWFDNDNSNDHNLITGLAIYYQFPFLQDFTIGLNRTMLSKWSEKNSYTLFKIYNPLLSSGGSGGDDASDQRVSITFDYLIKSVGFEIYFEWARNDFSPTEDHYIRYPFHTQGWTFGSQKFLSLPWGLQGALSLELTFLECSSDYDRLIKWYSTFYAHHKVTQGYTNKGQWLGAGIGAGGNSQYLGLSIYHRRGSVTLFGQRRNPDLDYSMFIDYRKQTEAYIAEADIRAEIGIGIESTYFVTKDFFINARYVHIDEHNPLYETGYHNHSSHRYNNAFSMKMKFTF